MENKLATDVFLSDLEACAPGFTCVAVVRVKGFRATKFGKRSIGSAGRRQRTWSSGTATWDAGARLSAGTASRRLSRRGGID